MSNESLFGYFNPLLNSFLNFKKSLVLKRENNFYIGHEY